METHGQMVVSNLPYGLQALDGTDSADRVDAFTAAATKSYFQGIITPSMI